MFPLYAEWNAVTLGACPRTPQSSTNDRVSTMLDAVTIRLASPDDLVGLRVLYTELLHVLATFNPTVDPSDGLQDVWVRRPGKLYPMLMERAGPTMDRAGTAELQRPELIGFALVCGAAYADAMGSATDYLLAEFLVTEKHRRAGTGRHALAQVLNECPGSWALDVLPNNPGAMKFWTRVLAPYAATQKERTGPEGVTFMRFEFHTKNFAR